MPSESRVQPTASERDVSESESSLADDEWIAAHYQRVFRSAWLMTGNRQEAEDLAQDTFVVAIDRWERFDGRSTRATWLYGILMRLSRKRWRSVARLKRRIEVYASRTQRREIADPQQELADRQWRESVWSEVATLPAKQREAVLLRFAEDMSYDQIAAAMNCAVGTAKTRVHTGLKKLGGHKLKQPTAIPSNQNNPTSGIHAPTVL